MTGRKHALIAHLKRASDVVTPKPTIYVLHGGGTIKIYVAYNIRKEV